MTSNTPNNKTDNEPVEDQNQQNTTTNNNAASGVLNMSHNAVFTSTLLSNIEELERTQSLGIFDYLTSVLQSAGTEHTTVHPEGSSVGEDNNSQQRQHALDNSPAKPLTGRNVSSAAHETSHMTLGTSKADDVSPAPSHHSLFLSQSNHFQINNPMGNSFVNGEFLAGHISGELPAEAFPPNNRGSVAFARDACEQHGHLEPLELALLQAETGTTGQTEQQQISAAEVLASIERLNAAEFALLAEATYDNVAHGLSSHLMYSGSAWYLPQINNTAEGEPENDISFSLDHGFSISLCGSKVTINIISLLLRLCFLLIFYGSLYLFLGSKLMSPGGKVFDCVVCFLVCSIVGGICGRIFGMPPLVFILLFSILWANVPESQFLTKGIPKDVRSIISRLGLTVILVRSGLSMTLKVIKPAAGNIMALAFLPILAEILVHGFMATSIIDYGDSKLWPFMQAMTCCPAASAVTGATVLLMRTWGFGITRGPGVILLPSVVLDMVIGILGINFMNSLIFRDESSSLGWAIGQGPVQVIVGPIAGIVAGYIWFKILQAMFREAKVLPHGKYARAFIRSRARDSLGVMLVFGICLVFGGYKIGAAGGGSLACVFMAATAAHLMTEEGVPCHFPQVKAKQYGYLASIWDLLIMPALFSIAASSISVTSMFAADFIGKAIACLVAGIATRIVVAFFCAYSYDLTVSERIITAIVSGGRATVQVALGPLALQTVNALPAGASPDLKRYATQVYDTAILGVLIMTPITVILLTRVAPKFWMTDIDFNKNVEEEKRKALVAAAAEKNGEEEEAGGEDKDKKPEEEELKEKTGEKKE